MFTFGYLCQYNDNLVMEDSGVDYFCFIQISSTTQMIIEIVLVVLSTVLIADAIRKFIKMRNSHNSSVTFIYTLILVWWISFVASSIFDIVLYWLISSNPDSYSSDEVSQRSKYNFVIVWVNAFAIQWLLLYVPYNWSKKILVLFGPQTERGSEVTYMEKQDYRGYERMIYPTLKVYITIRVFFLGLPVIFLILNDPIVYFKIMIVGLLLDCFFITFSLIFGMISLKFTKQLKDSLDEQQSKRMFNQYFMIIVANTIRFAFDITIVLASVINNSTYSHKCPDFDNSDELWKIVNNVGTALLTHFFPIFLILRIYNLEERPEQICKSLIISASENDSGVMFGN